MLIEGRDIWGLTTERGVSELLRVEGSCGCSGLSFDSRGMWAFLNQKWFLE